MDSQHAGQCIEYMIVPGYFNDLFGIITYIGYLKQMRHRVQCNGTILHFVGL